MSASREHGGPALAGEEHKTMAAAQARQLASLRMSPRFVPGGVTVWVPADILLCHMS